MNKKLFLAGFLGTMALACTASAAGYSEIIGLEASKEAISSHLTEVRGDVEHLESGVWAGYVHGETTNKYVREYLQEEYGVNANPKLKYNTVVVGYDFPVKFNSSGSQKYNYGVAINVDKVGLDYTDSDIQGVGINAYGTVASKGGQFVNINGKISREKFDLDAIFDEYVRIKGNANYYLLDAEYGKKIKYGDLYVTPSAEVGVRMIQLPYDYDINEAIIKGKVEIGKNFEDKDGNSKGRIYFKTSYNYANLSDDEGSGNDTYIGAGVGGNVKLGKGSSLSVEYNRRLTGAWKKSNYGFIKYNLKF